MKFVLRFNATKPKVVFPASCWQRNASAQPEQFIRHCVKGYYPMRLKPMPSKDKSLAAVADDNSQPTHNATTMPPLLARPIECQRPKIVPAQPLTQPNKSTPTKRQRAAFSSRSIASPLPQAANPAAAHRCFYAAHCRTTERSVHR